MSCAINKGGFFEIAFVSTHICLALKRLVTFCLTLMRSVFVECSKRSTTGVRISFGLSLHIFSMVRHCLWKMCATPGACINETGLLSSAAVVPESKSTELCSSAAVKQQSKSTEM